jgi:hypothetical protein
MRLPPHASAPVDGRGTLLDALNSGRDLSGNRMLLVFLVLASVSASATICWSRSWRF